MYFDVAPARLAQLLRLALGMRLQGQHDIGFIEIGGDGGRDAEFRDGALQAVAADSIRVDAQPFLLSIACGRASLRRACFDLPASVGRAVAARFTAFRFGDRELAAVLALAYFCARQIAS